MEKLALFINSIPAKSILSLDIFDTALTRMVATPKHIFAVMQGALLDKYGKRHSGGIFRNFIDERFRAESEARKDARSAGVQEVSLDDIYEKLSAINKNIRPYVDEIKTLEIETEIAQITPVPEIKEVYEQIIARGIKVIFTSDMYLPPSVIERMLHKCGYAKYEKLYLSSELKKTKGSGGLWDVVLETTGAETPIFHIGDNLLSDVEQAGKKGIQSFHFTKYSGGQKNYGEISEAIIPLSRLVAKERLKTLAEKSLSDVLSNIARTHLPLLFGTYIRWIDEQARLHGAKTIYFFSRDGWILKRVWKMLARQGFVSKKCRSVYAEVSRKALKIPAISTIDEDTLNFILSGGEQNRPVRIYLERLGVEITLPVQEKILKFFASPDEKVSTMVQRNQPMRDLLCSLEEEIVKAAEQTRSNALGYLRELGFFDTAEKKLIVDLGWLGNMQAGLLKLLSSESAYPKDVLVGLYVGLLREAHQNTYRNGYMQGMIPTEFQLNGNSKSMWNIVQLLELLHSAPHGSVAGYARDTSSTKEGHYKACYIENEQEKTLYNTKIGPMQEIALETLLTGLQNGDIKWEALSPAVYWETFRDLALYPSEKEAEAIGTFTHLDGFDHAGTGVRLIPDDPPKNLQDAISLTKQGRAPWVPGTIRAWIDKKALPRDDLLKLLDQHAYWGWHWKEFCRGLIS